VEFVTGDEPQIRASAAFMMPRGRLVRRRQGQARAARGEIDDAQEAVIFSAFRRLRSSGTGASMSLKALTISAASRASCGSRGSVGCAEHGF